MKRSLFLIYVSLLISINVSAQINEAQLRYEEFKKLAQNDYETFRDEKNNQACMLPTDGYGNDALTGYRLDNLYADLGEAPSQSTVVFLDACFSGTRRDGEMMTDVRGVAIKAKATNPIGNIIVFSAAQGDETAYPYDESKHGMFTFFLLNKLKETNGDVTLKELGDYISEKVSQKAIISKGKSQTPTVMVSNSIGNKWTTWKLK